MLLRDARPGDEAAVAEVHVRAWKVAYRGLIAQDFLDALRPQDRIPRYTFGSEDPQDPRTILAIDEPSGALLGFATFGASRDEDKPQAGELYALYVDPDRWRTGTGQILLAEVRTRLRQAGYREAILWVLAGNEPAEGFYLADGWARDGARREEDPWGVVSVVRRFRRAL